MSTITLARRRKANTTDWRAYREQRAYLADLFAVIAYSGQPKRPLALNVRREITAANTGLSNSQINNFLRAYMSGPKYLSALTRGANRYALDGSLRGYVTRDEAEVAAARLERRAIWLASRAVPQMYAEAA